MSDHFQAVNWNSQKRRYDAALAVGVAATLGGFAAASIWQHPALTAETIVIRGLAITAFVLLHVILCIGPLARLDPRFLPLLYNRRHLGVTMALLALAHAAFSVVQYHAGGDLPALRSLLEGAGTWPRPPEVPFELLGAAALVVLLLMATTSHDFWLAALGAAAWKRLHLLVLPAYALLTGHVAFGFLQDERHPALFALLAAGASIVFGLHLAAARRETARDRRAAPATEDGWRRLCRADEVPEGEARAVPLGPDRVAVVRHRGRISVLSNVCRHQGGPLGEGRVLDGCLTCPWHGYQYRPDDGCSPPPFTERVATYQVRVVGGDVQVRPRPMAPGTYVPPAQEGA